MSRVGTSEDWGKEEEDKDEEGRENRSRVKGEEVGSVRCSESVMAPSTGDGEDGAVCLVLRHLCAG